MTMSAGMEIIEDSFVGIKDGSLLSRRDKIAIRGYATVRLKKR